MSRTTDSLAGGPPIRAVVFDFNGVLIDDEHVHFSLFREVLAGQGVALDEAAYHDRYLGYDDWGCLEAALADAGKPAGRALLDELVARKAGRYLEVAAEGLRVFPGAAEALEALAGRFPIAICSGALRPEIELALRMMGRLDRVAAIVSAEDTTRGKPDPEGYRLAYEALRGAPGLGLAGLDPASCLVFEDSTAGLEAAAAAGMRRVGVANTYPADQLRAAGAEAVVDGLVGVDPIWVARTFGA